MKSISKSGIVNSTDIEILGSLQNNSRETLTRICRKTGIPISSIFDKLRRLEALGVITRHTCLLDMKKIGFVVRVLLLTKVCGKEKDELEQFFLKNQRVNNLVRISGDWDLMVDALFRDIKEVESFIETLKRKFDGAQLCAYHVLEELKQEHFLTDPDQVKGSVDFC